MYPSRVVVSDARFDAHLHWLLVTPTRLSIQTLPFLAVAP